MSSWTASSAENARTSRSTPPATRKRPACSARSWPRSRSWAGRGPAARARGWRLTGSRSPVPWATSACCARWGGMGVVYEAEQISLGRRVALKVLPFAAALDARQLQRFKNEAQAAAQLHHSNIVPVYAVGCERGVHYYAMQFIDGQTLAAVIRDLRPLAGMDAPSVPAAPAN